MSRIPCEITVTFASGQPARGARVSVCGISPFDMVCQDHYTDSEGVARLVYEGSTPLTVYVDGREVGRCSGRLLHSSYR